jgi:acyl-CoA synthetase (AMP-forming)/AMP-acid ligase II
VGDPVDRERKFDSVGTAMPGVEVRVAGEDGSWLPPGEIGEICVGPDESGRYQTMVGYWGDEEASAVALEGGFTHTGDVGYLDEDGFLFLVDRKKDVVFVGGWSVFPVEVENVLRDHPAVEFAAVVGVPDDRLGEIPKAYVQLRPDHQAGEAELIEYAKSRLASYKCPRQVGFVESMPRNALGKILKRKLRDLDAPETTDHVGASSSRGAAAVKER